MMKSASLPMTLPRLVSLVVAAVGLMLAAALARAAEDTGCKAFLWPIAKEQAAFARADLPTIESGSARGIWREQAFALKLKPVAEVSLPMPSSGQPMGKVEKPFAGFVAFEAPPEAGVYHVTLSGAAWIDVVQGGQELQAAAHTGAHDCPDVHKSVRFELKAAPLVLEISGSKAEVIKVGIVPAVD
jgi:hypothetical protein